MTADALERPAPVLGTFERWLTVWVALAIVGGIVLGQWAPRLFEALAAVEVAQVNRRSACSSG